jgi:predicted peroxiredoxin/TusA-related sulfurtransferase
MLLLTLIAAASLAGCSHARPPALPVARVAADRSLDMRGKTVAVFIIYHARKAPADMQDGQVLELVTDDYDAVNSDIRAWCRTTNQKLLQTEPGPGLLRHYIEKAPFKSSGKKLAMIVSNPGLEELLTPLGLALTAALSGNEVHLIFQGPAVRVLKQGFSAKLSGWSWPFSGFARDGMANAGHLPPQEKLAQLRELGAKLYTCGPSMDHFGVTRSELAYSDVIVGEYAVFLEAIAGADVTIMLQ